MPLLAQASEQTKLEEVLVTAQVRTESMQDVPVSMAAIGGDKLQEAGLNKLEDLATQVPNLKMTEAATGTSLFIRGIGSGLNQGFEQSVGMYVDGVYYGRAQLARAPFLDLARVEVLRGPQNILYGKNSIAGAISMLTARPGDELEAMVSGLYEPRYNEQVYDVMASGPITDTLGARLAYRNRSSDGYTKDLTLDRDEPNRDEQTARLTFAWQPTDTLEATLKYEHGSFDSVGRQIEIINDQPAAGGAFAGLTQGQILSTFPGVGTSTLNNRTDYKRSSNGDFSDNDTNNATLTVNWQVGDHTLTSITNWLNYKYSELCDCDFTGAPLFNVKSSENYDQYSQEFRIVSPAGKTIEYIAGGYYQTSDLGFKDRFYVPTGSPTPQVIAGGVRQSLIQNVLAANPGLTPAQAAAAVGANPQAQGLINGSVATFTNLAAPRTFTQDTDLWSVFAQLTWNIRDDLRLIAGGRYTSEKKDGTRTLTFDNNGVATSPTGLNIIAATLKAESQNLADSRDESNFAPQIALQYDINHDIMVYASATRGYKSGGYDARSNQSPGGPAYQSLSGQPFVLNGIFEYGNERATGYEIGAKAIVAQGAGEVNIAAFRTEYEDLQISTFDGVLGFNVGNAAEAVSQGVELDSRWLVMRGLMVSASLAYLDFEFTNYPDGQCVQGQAPTTPGTINCNYKGKTNQYVADWTGNLGADYTLNLTDYLDLRTTIDFIFTSDYNPSQNLDARVQQPGYGKINARVALVGNGDQWEVALVGKNLTDKKTVAYANDTPLAYTFFGTVAHYGIVEEPRTVAVQGTYRF
jgi:outer membrane receptor protein involved in Fe transport